MNELRLALWAFLDAGDLEFEGWKPLVDRLGTALDAVGDADALDALAQEFRAEALRRGQVKFAHSPLYPWGVVSYLDTRRDWLRYEAHSPSGPCNCALVHTTGLLRCLDSREFQKRGESDDFYEPWEELECPHCGALWRHENHSTEQYSAWSWQLIRAGGGW